MMCRDDISKRIETLVGNDCHAVTRHLLKWPESYALYHEEYVGHRANHRRSSAMRKLNIFKVGVVDALIAHGVGKSDIDTYYDPIRNWVNTCFLRGYITWGKEIDWNDKKNQIKELALGMMVAVDGLTISTEDIDLVKRIVPRLLNGKSCEYIAEELDSEVNAVKENCQRIDKIARTKCLQNALVVPTDHLPMSNDERQVSGLFVARQSERFIAGMENKTLGKVKEILDGVVRKAASLNLSISMAKHPCRDIFTEIAAGVSFENIANNKNLNSILKEKDIKSYVESEVKRKILLDLQEGHSQLINKQRRESILRATGGHPTDLAGPDVEVLSTVAMIQSWIRVWVRKKHRGKARIGDEYRRGIVELQESWNVDSDSVAPSSSLRRRCRLATTSFIMWNNCVGYSGGPFSCGLSLDPAINKGRASGQVSYNEWGKCRFLGDDADRHLPLYNRLRCLHEVEKMVEEIYGAAARNFVSAKLPEVRWWWDQWPGEAGSEEDGGAEMEPCFSPDPVTEDKYFTDRARRLEAQIGLSEVVTRLKQLVKRLGEEEARIVRMATEGHSIDTIAAKCDKTRCYIYDVLSKTAAIPEYSTLTRCWKR